MYIKKILLADDDEDDRDFFRDALAAISSQTALVTAEDGLAALDVLHKSTQYPDLVFLDLNMPKMNGHDCLADIRQNKELQHLPVVIFSTSAQPEMVDSVYDIGASLYVVKPHSFPVLKDLLKRVLTLNWTDTPATYSRENFILQA